MGRLVAKESCSGAVGLAEARARIVVASGTDGLLANALGDLGGAIATVTVRSRAEALRALADGDAWVLVTEPRLGPDSGIELARSAIHRDGDLTALVLYDESTLPEVLRTVREGTTMRFLDAATGADVVLRVVRGCLQAREREEMQRADRRAFPRVTPHDVEILHPPGAHLVDVTPDGLAFRTDEPVGADLPLPLVLRVGRKLRVECTAEVVRQQRDALGRCSVAARFTKLTPHSKRALQTTVRRQLAAIGPREMQRRFRESSAADVVPITRRERIEALLSRARDERILVTAQVPSSGMSWKGTVRAADGAAGRFRLDAPATITGVAPGQSVDCLLQQEFESYLFESHVSEVGLDSLVCDLPVVVYYSEKRSRIRLQIESSKLSLAFPHPKGNGSWLEFEVLDVSASGASFAVDLDRYVILPGTVLDPVRITLGDHVVLTERGEVRHVTPLGNGNEYKIGLRYAPSRLPRGTVEAAITTAEAPTRLQAASHRAQLVRFGGADGEEVVALLNLTTRRGGAAGPVIVIAPSWGFSKEAFSAYSLTLVDAFERLAVPAAVLRFDYTHHKGESHIPPENRLPGREALDFRLSRAVDDILAAVDFCFNTPLLQPTRLVLLGPSFSAPLVLRAAATDRRIDHVAIVMGTPNSQELVKNASGGVDYFGAFRHGARFGVVDFLGLSVNMDRIAADAIRSGLAFAADAERDLRKLQVPVDWFAARHDGWINPRQVERLLECGRPEQCELSVLECGHLPTRDEGLVVAAAVTRTVLRRLGLDESAATVLSPALLEAVQQREWSRAPKARVESSGGYWRQYLLGARAGALGFDVFSGSAAYQEFAGKQIELSKLGAAERLLDAGGGTGQLVHHLLTHWTGPLPQSIEIVDLVPEALERARGRIAVAPRAAEVAVTFRAATLEVSPLRPLQRFLAGEYPSILSLRGRIRGLTDELLERLMHEYELPTAARLHAAVRGAVTKAEDLRFLDEDLRAVVTDLGRAARLLRGELSADDRLAKSPADGTPRGGGRNGGAVGAEEVAFEILEFGDAGLPRPLDLPTAGYDRIVCSLVLPYLRNPDETVLELARALRPGGILVVSTMKPDLDLSKLQAELVAEIVAGGTDGAQDLDREQLLEEVRSYSGAAAFLLRLTQEGTFRFLTPADVTALLTSAGLEDVELHPAFGTPPQAYIASGRRP